MKSIKARTQEQWSKIPIGTETTGFESFHERFSREYFDDHSRFRFGVYAPWLPKLAGFEEFAGKNILEVGCGMGTDLLEYAKGGARVTGLDLTPRHIELSMKRFKMFGQWGNFLIGDAECLPFPDQSFDFVYSNGVLHHTPRTQVAADEIHRVLKPGGQALVLLYHKFSLVYYLSIMLKSGSKRFVRHLLSRKPLSEFSLERVLSTSTDGNENPLTKVYTRREGQSLMRRFSNVSTEVVHLMKGDFPLSSVFPSSLLEWLSGRMGWYLVLRGNK